MSEDALHAESRDLASLCWVRIPPVLTRQATRNRSIWTLHIHSTGNPQRNLVYSQEKIHCPQVVLLRFPLGRNSLPHPHPAHCRPDARRVDPSLDPSGARNGTQQTFLTGVDTGVRLVRGPASRAGAAPEIRGCPAGPDPRHMPALPRRISPRSLRRRDRDASRRHRGHLDVPRGMRSHFIPRIGFTR